MIEKALILARRYWTIFILGTILILGGYQFVKEVLSWHFASQVGKPVSVSYVALLLVLTATFGALIVICYYDRLSRLNYILIPVVFLLASMGVFVQEGGNHIKWGDVATDNYAAALVVMEVGPVNMISTWNARANPYVEPNYLRNPQELTGWISCYNLQWAAGTRWDRLDLPQDNSRMFMHPPLYPVVLAGWLKIFGKSREVALSLVLVIKICLILMTVLWVKRLLPDNDGLNTTAITVLFATCPLFIHSLAPQANELGAMFAVGAFMFGINPNNRVRFIACMVSGILFAASAYTNIFYVFPLVFASGFLFLSPSPGHRRCSLGVLTGASMVFLLFTFLGYYPWLTLLTGTHALHYYKLGAYGDTYLRTDILTAVLNHLNFGFPLLALIFLGILVIPRLRGTLESPWEMAALISLVIGTSISFRLLDGPRYLMGMLFLMIPMLIFLLRNLKLSRAQVMLIPLSNLVFILLVQFM